MRGLARIIVAAGLLACVAALPTGTASAAPVEDDGTDWGLIARGGVFGVPNVIVDKFFVRHPAISGSIAGVEVRYFGDGGGRGISSIGLAVDHGSTEGDGTWQSEETDRPVEATGTVTMTAITISGYWNLFPSWFLHPYVGLGVGAAHFAGEYAKDGERVEQSGWLPVIHLPVGLALELGRNLQFSAEGRFLGGFSGGAALQLRF